MFTHKEITRVKKFFARERIYKQLKTAVSFLIPDRSNIKLTLNIGGGSFTDGNSITVGLPDLFIRSSYEEIFTALRALVGHEAQHINSSDFDAYKAYQDDIAEYFVKKYPKMNARLLDHYARKIAIAFGNGVEDGRIEKILGNKFPGYVKYLKFLNGRIWEAQEMKGNSEIGDFLHCIVTYAVTGLNPKGFDKVWKGTRLEENFNKIKPMIIQGINAVTCRQCLHLCKDMILAVEPYLVSLLENLTNVDQETLNNIPNTPEFTTSSEVDFNTNTTISVHFKPEKTKSQKDKDEKKGEQKQNQPGQDQQKSENDANENKDGGQGDHQEEKDQNGSASGSQQEQSEEQDSSGEDMKSSGKSEESSEDGKKDSAGSSKKGEENAKEDGDKNQANSDQSGDEESADEGTSENNDGADSGDSDSQSKYNQSEAGSDLDTNSSGGTYPDGVNVDGEKDSVDTDEQEIPDEDLVSRTMDELLKEVEEDVKDKISEKKEKKSTEDIAEEQSKLTAEDIAEIEKIYEEDVANKFKEVRGFPLKHDLHERIKREGKMFRKVVERIFRNKEAYTLRNQRKGIIDRSSLWKVGAKDYNVFLKKGVPVQSDFVAFLLQDGSGSMMKDNKQFYSAYAVAIMEEGLKGIIPFKIATFSVDWNTHSTVHYVVKDFKENLMQYNYAYNFLYHRKASGGNKDGFSIRIATKELLKRPEKDKILIVFSDGLPSDYAGGYKAGMMDVKEAVKEARAAGIYVVSLIFGEESFRDMNINNYKFMYEKNIISCDPSQITSQLVRLLKKLISR